MVMTKYGLEGKLHEEHRLIKDGILRDDNPLDQSNEFNEFLIACRHGDLRKCQELINMGVNINGKDKFDYTPLIIASLCGHYELVQLLLEAGALAERNTFQGERCIYNALNDRIRNLLLRYDFSKSSDPFVYWSSHITALMDLETPNTSDITLTSDNRSFELHKFLLSARSPYFRKKLEAQPETETWKLATAIPDESFQVVLQYIYLGDVPKDLSSSRNNVSDEAILTGVDKISKQLEIDHLWEAILEGNDRRLARQRYQDEVGRALKQVSDFFQASIIGHKMVVDTDRVDEITWKHGNSIFADILLRADQPEHEDNENDAGSPTSATSPHAPGTPSIPIGPDLAAAPERRSRKSVLYPVHKAMLIRSDYFQRMFSGDFVEARRGDRLRVVTIDCSPAVLELVLAFLYTETVACPLEHALELLYAADMLFLDALKAKAAVAISTLGSGRSNALVDRTHGSAGSDEKTPAAKDQPRSNGSSPDDVDEPINIYDVIHAAWDLRVQRLEEFAARYLAHRLEDYIDDPEFQELIRESAHRIRAREETDTIELLDDIRYYLSERFRLRFEDANLDILEEEEEVGEVAAATAAAAAVLDDVDGPPAGDDAAAATNGVHTLEGEATEDEFASDAINYQVLLGKIDSMLERLELDA
ncbi:ankyrin repeat and BTB/POZ domain-containing protein 1 [Cordyceps fumosorosea ARSEF 2679]|uniref:Ankyrin repeat and BTB/POZ domain-containing protein 1 n=1 Tax=Cordyceps fumosorosea (strain ARSEF 2679) TaxID=1081104 RepID=A0A167TJ23_CORFA|nr:ankyrin repeat and BTB/POZ domain-containing protein 1 [Cordyceps fumosorosea ARSEF 2679]OAA60648.1 ankyrin repeat and BTB/POZ domain-containing protein 1 [Cordyceps fumosorosea ARSEF 2679]